MKQLLLKFVLLFWLCCPAQELKKADASKGSAGVLLQNAEACIRKSGGNLKVIDSAFAYLKRADKLTGRDAGLQGRSLLLYAMAYGETQNKPKAREYANRAIKWAQGKKDIALESRAYQVLYTLSDWYTQKKEKGEYLDKSLSLARRSKDKEALASILAHAAEFYNDSDGDAKKGIKAGLESIKIYKEIGGQDLTQAYRVLGYNYIGTGEYQKAIDNSLLALRYAEKQGNALEQTYIFNQIASVYHHLKEYNTVIEYMRKAMESAYKAGVIEQIYYTANNFAQTLIAQGRYSEAEKLLSQVISKYKTESHIDNLTTKLCLSTLYEKLGNYSKAQKYTREMLEIANRYKDELPPHLVFHANYTAACFYFKFEQYLTAEKYLDLARIHAEQGKNSVYKKYVDICAYKIDSAQGDFEQALKHYQHAKKYDDSIYNVEKRNQISELQIQYETEKKDKDLKLFKKDAELQRSKARQDRITRNITFGGILLVLVLAGILFKGYKLKQRVNKRLEAQKDEISNKNDSLNQLVQEKEWLLKEIHHRVKNNLQIVISLLDSQSVYLKDKAALSAIRDSQHRVHSMSLIHQKLYQSANLAVIPMQLYISELVNYLRDSFATRHIIFQVAVDDIELDVGQSIPIGLILNEAITNAIKYAFPNERDGEISVKLLQDQDDHIELTISDNGIGLPQGFDPKNVTSLGMSLIQGLSDDLEADFSIYNNGGTVIKLKFTRDTFKKHS